MVERRDDFWEKYTKADELERHELLETLPIMKGASKETGLVKVIITATLLQGYFDDLIECVKHMQGEKCQQVNTSPSKQKQKS